MSSSNDDDNEETLADLDRDGDEDEDDADVEQAVDIIDSVRLGSGARITCLAAWISSATAGETKTATPEKETSTESNKKVKHDGGGAREVVMDNATLEKARALVSKAKKIQKRKSKKKHKLGQRR
jgi:hypothetical protein